MYIDDTLWILSYGVLASASVFYLVWIFPCTRNELYHVFHCGIFQGSWTDHRYHASGRSMDHSDHVASGFSFKTVPDLIQAESCLLSG